MTINNRVVWSEGLFLMPQHFQQQDRHTERHVDLRVGAPHPWLGFHWVEIDRDLLVTGKRAAARTRCVPMARRSACLTMIRRLPRWCRCRRDCTVLLAIPL
jgi:hypothetical protein